jgi:uncharacterized protein
MRIVISGATGFIGRALVLRLARDGHSVSALVRSPEVARAKLGDEAELVDINDVPRLDGVIGRCDAIINLAGESVLGGRWTARRRRLISDSRIGTTRTLVASLERTKARIKAFVSASAIGVYGDVGDHAVNESSATADDFLARLCVAWEAEAARAAKYADRVAIVRIGIVLGDGGGALAKMLPLFRLGLGGTLGSGAQWVSWIHLNDLVEVFAQAVTDERYSGVINGTAPHPVTNRELTRTLGKLLRRPTFAAVPAFALELALGSAASAVLASQRVHPTRLHELGFKFTYEVLDAALAQITYHAPTVLISRIVAERPDNAYMRRRRPTHVLYDRTLIDAPIADVFVFFGRAANIGALTPPEMALTLHSSGELAMERGLSIDHGITIGGIPLTWRTFIEEWSPGERFVDTQIKGPFRCWYHEHVFRADGDRTMMEDRVWYALPFGPLGRMVHVLKVRSMLRRLFEYRTTRLALRFGRVRSESRQPAKHSHPVNDVADNGLATHRIGT